MTTVHEILDQVFLDNTLRQYLITTAIIAIVLLIKKYIAHSIAGLLYKLIHIRWKSIDKSTFKTLVAKPLGYFLAVFITVASLDRLRFPQVLDFHIYHISFEEVLRIVGTGLIIITFFLFIIKWIDFIMMAVKEKYMQEGDAANHQLIFFFKDFIKAIVIIIGILFILKYCFNYEIKGLVTGLSIVGAAIALALKESLENLIASFIIFFDKPFTVGDAVTINNISGTIEKIGLRSTRIRSNAKTYITMPNKQMVDSVLDNLSWRTQRRVDLTLYIDPATAADKVQQLTSGITAILKTDTVQNFSIVFTDITPNALVIAIEYYTAPVDANTFGNIRQQLNIAVLQLLTKMHIATAEATTNVQVTTTAVT